MRYTPVRLPNRGDSRRINWLAGALALLSTLRASLRSTSGPRLVFDLLPALAGKTLFVSLRETSSRPFVHMDSLGDLTLVAVVVQFEPSEKINRIDPAASNREIGSMPTQARPERSAILPRSQKLHQQSNGQRPTRPAQSPGGSAIKTWS